MEEGVDGLLRDKTRKPGKEPVPEAVVEQPIERTLGQPPGETTHWTSRAMAKLMGLASSTVQTIWRARGPAPHRLRTFKLSRDPQFASKVRDVIGLYVGPPAHAVALSVDEKSQIQALDRAQPGLPMKKGRAGTMTHDYKRNGTTTLSAALNVLDGPVGSAAIPPGDRAQGPMVIGQRMPRHRAAASRRDPMPEGPPVGRPARRHREPIRFLNRIGRDVPAGKVIHVVLDNYGSHRHQKVRARLARHPRWTFHFTPTSASWLNAAEGFLAKLTNRRLRRGGFHSLVDLQAAVNRYLAEPNRSPAPFVRTAKPDAIIAAASRGRQMLDSIH